MRVRLTRSSVPELAPLFFDVIVVVVDVVMGVKQHACQHKTTERGAENDREPGMNR